LDLSWLANRVLGVTSVALPNPVSHSMLIAATLENGACEIAITEG
jgi:hypothetical protein